VDFVGYLRAELERRQAANPRYSLRRLAQALGTSHSSLSRLCRGVRRPRLATIALVGRRLGLSPQEIARAVRCEHVERLRAAARQPHFSANVRWLAVHLNLSIDDVQIALQEALRTRRLSMVDANTWNEEH
jgi:transcriptional regulator with XRE-family HTH domain